MWISTAGASPSWVRYSIRWTMAAWNAGVPYRLENIDWRTSARARANLQKSQQRCRILPQTDGFFPHCKDSFVSADFLTDSMRILCGFYADLLQILCGFIRDSVRIFGGFFDVTPIWGISTVSFNSGRFLKRKNGNWILSGFSWDALEMVW